jgi:hypothetical protein
VAQPGRLVPAEAVAAAERFGDHTADGALTAEPWLGEDGQPAGGYSPCRDNPPHQHEPAGARRRGVGYQTLINEVLAEHVRKDVA